MLSVKEMKAAIYARMCDREPNFETGKEAAEYDAAFGHPGSVSDYELGKKVLEKYSLRYDYRSTVHTMSNGKYPGEDEGKSGTLRCEAGYTANAQAYDTAIFNPREK
jgi:hypothetical protein